MLTRSLSEPVLPYVGVLEELPSAGGVLLWRLLQDATLWRATPFRRRAGLFFGAPGIPSGVLPPMGNDLDTLSFLVRDPHPDAGPVMANLCDRLRVWAEGEGHPRTALACAQVAALLEPARARYAYQVGRLARMRAEHARADVWYRRAVVLGMREKDREAQAMAYGGIANLLIQRGSYAAAVPFMEKSVKLARRHSLPEVLGRMRQGLAALHFELGEVHRGMRYARMALRGLGKNHWRIPFLVHDMAVALMDQCGAFSESREILRTVLPHFSRPEDRLPVLANIARAAGALGEARLFDAVWTEARTSLMASADTSNTDVLVALAQGAASLRRWRDAREVATQALSLARERREGKSIYVAEAVLGAVEAERRFEEGEPCRPSCEREPDVLSFARDLLGALTVRTTASDDLLGQLRAVLADPYDSRLACALGRALRLAGEHARAEAWVRHGMEMAREGADAAAEALCLGELGTIHAERGEPSAALGLQERRLELARAHGLRDEEGGALRDLCVLELALDRSEAAFAHAREALDMLGPEDFSLPGLAYALAKYLLEERGDYENALSLFQILHEREAPGEDRLLLGAYLSRAAAGAGHARLFEKSWTAAASEMEGRPESERPPGALCQLAHGALIRGHLDLAEQVARQAREAAAARKDEETVRAADRLVEEAVKAGRTRARTPPWRHPEHDGREVQELIQALVSALRVGSARPESAAWGTDVRSGESRYYMP